MNNNINSQLKDKKIFTLKFFVSENELLFIKGCLNNLNEKLKNKNTKTKEKSISEFLREIVLENLINCSKNEDCINEKIFQLEMFVKRNLALTFKSLEKQFGKEETKKIFDSIREEEKNNS